MVPNELRNDIWQELLDSTRCTRYYTALAENYRRRDRAIKYLTIASASGYLSAWLDILPLVWQSPVQAVASGAIALLVLWGLVSEYARKEALLHTVSVECAKIEDEWRALWNDVNINSLSQDDIISRRDHLKQEGMAWTQRPGYANISDNTKLHKQCADEAYKVMKDRYAT